MGFEQYHSDEYDKPVKQQSDELTLEELLALDPTILTIEQKAAIRNGKGIAEYRAELQKFLIGFAAIVKKVDGQ